MLSHFIAYLNFTQTVLDNITQYVRRVFCEFVILRVASEQRSTHYATRKNFTLGDVVWKCLRWCRRRNRKIKIKNKDDDHDCDDVLMTLTTIYLMMAIVLYQVWEVFATCPTILNDLMIYKCRWDRCSFFGDFKIHLDTFLSYE